MNASQTLEASRPQPDPAEVGDPDVLVISDNHIVHLALPGHQQGNLTFDLTGNGGDLAGQFMRDDLIGGYSAAVQILKSFLLTGLEAACLSEYFIDRGYLSIVKSLSS
jgi:hypothetical protein